VLSIVEATGATVTTVTKNVGQSVGQTVSTVRDTVRDRAMDGWTNAKVYTSEVYIYIPYI
jgi:hypothetical protein